MIDGTPPEYDKKENARRLREGLRNHIEAVARKGREKYPSIDSLETLDKLLNDPDVVRFPTCWFLDDDNLLSGEIATAEGDINDQEGGFSIYVHPHFEGRGQDLIAIILHMIVKVNYGKIARDDEADLFGSILLDMPVDDYHEWIESLRNEAK